MSLRISQSWPAALGAAPIFRRGFREGLFEEGFSGEGFGNGGFAGFIGEIFGRAAGKEKRQKEAAKEGGQG